MPASNLKKVDDDEETPGGDELTTEAFYFLCRRCGLQRDDFEDMTIGMCIDYIDEYIREMTDPKERVREATQADFDAF